MPALPPSSIQKSTIVIHQSSIKSISSILFKPGSETRLIPPAAGRRASSIQKSTVVIHQSSIKSITSILFKPGSETRLIPPLQPDAAHLPFKNQQSSFINRQSNPSHLFHSSPAFTIVPAGTTALGPMNAPAAIQQPSPVSLGPLIRSNEALRKSWLPEQRNARCEIHTLLPTLTLPELRSGESMTVALPANGER